jgi:hypothetical protein
MSRKCGLSAQLPQGGQAGCFESQFAELSGVCSVSSFAAVRNLLRCGYRVESKRGMIFFEELLSTKWLDDAPICCAVLTRALSIHWEGGAEHWSLALRLILGRFILNDVPVFDKNAILDTQNVGRLISSFPCGDALSTLKRSVSLAN